MSFTDEDLKRLKDLLEDEACIYLRAFGGQEIIVPQRVYEASTQLWRMLLDKTPTLLSRLEAAEAYAKAMRSGREGWDNNLYSAWRKAAGK